MSRYFQQLARHAGLAPSGPAGAGLPPPTAPAPQADLTEEVIERDAVPATPDSSTSATPVADSPGLQPAVSSLDSNFSTTAESPGKIPTAGQPGNNPAPVKPGAPAREITAAETSRPHPPSLPLKPAQPDTAATVIQQVVAWIAEPERERALQSAPPLIAASTKADPPSTTAPIAQVAPPPSAGIRISPPARRTETRVSPAPESDGKRPDRSDQPKPQHLEIVAPPRSSPSPRPGARPAPAPRPSAGSPSEFHVSIGSIHLTVEAPPPAAPPPAPARRPAAAPSAPARTTGPATQARRHYLRSIN